MSTAASRAARRARIAEIDARISSLKNSIRLLKAEKLRTQERLDLYTYPVLMLPSEITSEIFMKFIPEYPSPPPLTGLLSPTTLTHVCRRWRAIAHSTPALWRAIMVPAYLCTIRNEAYLLSILESWLSRSRSFPLSISTEDMFEVLSGRLCRGPRSSSSAMEYVTLTVLDECVVHTMHGAMPLLRQFEIRTDFIASPPSPIRFCEVPQLRSVTIWEYPQLRETAGIDIFPWSQLTSLTLIDVDGWPAILKETANLLHCHLFLCGEEDLTVPDIRLPVLESLVLSPFSDSLFGPDEPATNALPSLFTPALRILEVPESFLQPDPIAMLDSFISKSGCDLQKICITGNTRSVPEAMYHASFFYTIGLGMIPRVSFDMSLTNYESYEKKLARRRYEMF
ncbi:F-box domain-containing protein [Mycena sanguinolenta]|uniref:F-box domain-containing protein n=1 Tax=Mycena sanguinolenta TaxID=230812 RepID=A0A8H6X8G8_9AGAR|nr:F-box domain-containing protein [Mycena sanguinolenta]